MIVVKRDGRTQIFNSEKIKDAITKAFIEVDGCESDYSKLKSEEIANSICNINKDMSVEEIQDIVEKKLMSTNRKDVAKAYIVYRNNRNIERNKRSKLTKNITKRLKASNVENQNANIDEKSFGGKMGAVTSDVLKEYALNNCVSKKTKDNHNNNEVYIHDLDHYATGDHNCFQRNTRFITDSGIRSFENFNDGESVTVLTKEGTWNKATVRMYGRQAMNKVTLQRCGKTKVVNCTSNHRWILSNCEVTTSLKVGDRLICLPDISDRFEILTDRDAEMFCLGFVIGDGCDHYIHNNLTIQAVLCEDKKLYAEIFERAHFHSQSNGDNDNILYSKRTDIGKQQFLDNKMWNLLSHNDKVALFNGYLAADGSKTTDTKYVWTSDDRVLNMIKDICMLSGYHIFKIKEQTNSTNYKENRTLFEVTFSTKYSNNSTWEVVNIEKQPNKDYEAWCIEEPITHSFTLEDGIITGNCLSIPFDDLLAKGFNTRQVDIRPAGSINTAFQLVAVIFQLQSLQQFGGCSATHLDWTMIPYVRKSFWKHFKDGLHYVQGEEFPSDDFFDPDMSIDSDIYKVADEAYQYAMDMTIRECQQAVEGLYHNLNSLQSRSGNQLPFTSINYGTCTLTEGRLITKCLLEGCIKGVGKFHRTSIFPCGIFQCMKGVNRAPGDPNYDLFQLALRSTSQRLYPNYCNCDWSGNAGYDINDPKTYFSTIDTLVA